jgi:RimJ/RimL family protein N-acetyltransferase
MLLVPIHRANLDHACVAAAREPAVASVIEATFANYARRGFQPPWIGYLGLMELQCVGAAGFVGPPRDGEVEIAYHTFPGHEGRGVATRMAAELIALAQRTDVRPALVAHTLPCHGPSTTILRKLGFALVGPIIHPEDGSIWKWRQRSPADNRPAVVESAHP